MMEKKSKIKERGLFDHVKHIRQVQSKDYISTLSESELKSFNHYMILKAISMDPAMVNIVSILYRYFDKIPTNRFYQLLIDIVPKSSKFYPWIKNGKKKKYNSQLLYVISKNYEVSNIQSVKYLDILTKDDDGISTLVDICRAYGLDDEEIERIITE